MKVVDYEALKTFKAHLDRLYATKEATESLAGDVSIAKQKAENCERQLKWL